MCLFIYVINKIFRFGSNEKNCDAISLHCFTSHIYENLNFTYTLTFLQIRCWSNFGKIPHTIQNFRAGVLAHFHHGVSLLFAGRQVIFEDVRAGLATLVGGGVATAPFPPLLALQTGEEVQLVALAAVLGQVEAGCGSDTSPSAGVALGKRAADSSGPGFAFGHIWKKNNL